MGLVLPINGTEPGTVMSEADRRQHLSNLIVTEHQQIGALFDAIYTSLKSAGSISNVQTGLLAQLVNVTTKHFRNEEEMMRLIPDWQRSFGWHMGQHRILLFELIKLLEDAPRREVGSTLRLIEYLGDWMVDHMNNVDPSLEQITLSERELDSDLLRAAAAGKEPEDWVSTGR